MRRHFDHHNILQRQPESGQTGLRGVHRLFRASWTWAGCVLLIGFSACSTPEGFPLAPPTAITSASPSVAATPTATPTPTPAGSTQANTRIETRIEIIQPSPSPTATPTASPTPVSSPVPIATPTPTPIATPTPSPTATPFTSSGSGSGSSSGSVSQATFVPPVVTGIEIAGLASNQLDIGKSLDLHAWVSLSDGGTSQLYNWVSSDEQIASVDASGLVRARRTGSVVITATSTATPTISSHLTLTVTRPLVRFKGDIIYLANGDIYIMKGSNANPIRLTHTGFDISKVLPRLSWNGDLIAYRVSGDDIMTVGTSGSDTPVLHELAPSGRLPKPYIWYNGEIVYQDDFILGDEHSSLFRIKPDGTTHGWMNNLGFIGNIAGISAAGEIVFEQGPFVKYCIINKVETKRVLGIGGNPKLPKNAAPSQVVYTSNFESSNFDIFSVPLSGGTPINLTQHEANDDLPEMSPDESQIVFVSDRDGGQDLFMMNADGSNVRNLTHTPDVLEVQPDWSY